VNVDSQTTLEAVSVAIQRVENDPKGVQSVFERAPIILADLVWGCGTVSVDVAEPTMTDVADGHSVGVGDMILLISPSIVAESVRLEP
jgi:hypothetical protein